MTAPKTSTPRRGNRMFQVRLPVFMVVVAGSALILWAGMFNVAHRDMATSWTSYQVEALASEDAADRRIAAEMLTNVIAEQAARVTPALIVVARDRDASVRKVAASSLCEVLVKQLPKGSTSVPAAYADVTSTLIRLLGDPDAKVRIEAVRSLGKLEPHVTVTQTRLPGKKVTYTFRPGADPDRALPVLMALLIDPDVLVVNELLTVFPPSYLRERWTQMPELAAKARNAPENERPQAIALYAAALNALGHPGSDLMTILEETGNADARRALIVAIGNPMTGFGRRTWSDRDALAQALSRLVAGGKIRERVILIEALGGLGFTPPEAVPSLIAAVESDDPKVQNLAAKALTHTRRPAVEALPALLRAARAQTDPESPLSVLDAILAIDPEGSITPEIVPLLEARARASGNAEMRAYAIETLGKLGPAAEPAVPLLIVILGLEVRTPEDRELRDLAVLTLARIGPAARPALPRLASMARASMARKSPRFEEAQALFLIGPDSIEAADVLLHTASLTLQNPTSRSSPFGPFYRSIAPVIAPALDRIRELNRTADLKTRYIAGKALEVMEPLTWN